VSDLDLSVAVLLGLGMKLFSRQYIVNRLIHLPVIFNKLAESKKMNNNTSQYVSQSVCDFQ